MTAMTGSDLRIFRRYYALTIPDLCHAIDVDRRSVNRWENGESPIPEHITEAISDLRDKVQQHLEDSLATHAGHKTIPLYRWREELISVDPFYNDLPASLHEWEVAMLCDELEARPVHSPAWESRYVTTHAAQGEAHDHTT